MGRKKRKAGRGDATPRRGKRRSIRYDAFEEGPRERRPRGPAPPPAVNLRRMRAPEALHHLAAQLRAFGRAGRREVLVVHGRGLNSPRGRPVLKELVRQWCDRHPEVVAGWREAPREWGGEGAIVVHLAG